MRINQIFIIFFIFIFLILKGVDCRGKTSKQFDLQRKETNTPNFVRLFVMRLIYGIASSMGLEDRLSGFLGGFFVPPGADDDYSDYGGDDDGLFGDVDIL